jgi:hypothetical protein
MSLTYPPTAVHAMLVVQDTAERLRDAGPEGLGVDWIAQLALL